MGQFWNPKSAIVHCIALSQDASSATISAVGFTSTPCTLLVLLWPLHARYIAPYGRSTSTMHRSRCFARFSHCFAGGWTTNRPSSVFANSKASAISSSATVVERSSVSQAYSEISTRVVDARDVWDQIALPDILLQDVFGNCILASKTHRFQSSPFRFHCVWYIYIYIYSGLIFFLNLWTTFSFLTTDLLRKAKKQDCLGKSPIHCQKGS